MVGELVHTLRQIPACMVINSGLPLVATVWCHEALNHAATSKSPLHMVVKILV